MDKILCLDSEATTFGLFNFQIAPDLLYYAYIPVLFVALAIGVLVIFSDSKFKAPNVLFFWFTLVYGLYLANEVVQWIAIPAGLVYFSWELIALFFVTMSFLLYGFIYTFVEQQKISLQRKLIILLLTTPVLFLLNTKLNISEFNLVSCTASIGYLYYYIYALMIGVGLNILFIGVRGYLKTKRRELLPVTAGALLMLAVLLLADLVSEHFRTFEINLVGPVGMLAFMCLLTYVIVQFRAFNVNLLATQALTTSIIVLVGSQLFFIKTSINFVLTTITLVATISAGYFLVRSVKREVRLREEIQQLAQDLARANERLERLDKLKSEFVSIASHQLRSPLTTMIGYASMLRDGSYGKLPAKALEAASRIEESSRLMATSVEDYLNVSRIEAGHMKYNLTDFSLAEQALHITDDIRPIALKQNIVLLYRTKLEGKGTVNADKGKTEQILHNLINNAIKYTKQGTITVVLHDDLAQKKITVDIIDSGIGMSPETQRNIFQKFERGSNANSTNIHGTGLGLYTAAKLAEAMGGKITAHSDGEGKGSCFTLELPLLA